MRYSIHVPDGGREPVDATDDYDEARALCRALVLEDGYVRAEVWRGAQVCCAAERDAAGRLRLLDDGDRHEHLERDVTHRLLAADPAERTDDRGGARGPLFFGEDHAGRPTRWLGL